LIAPKREEALSPWLVRLSVLVGVLALVSASAGLLWQGSGETISVTNVQGQTSEILGRGLYRNDTLFVAGNNQGSDLVIVFLGLPLLATSLVYSLKGSMRGRLMLLGTLGFFLYIGSSYALGAVAYNELFLNYVALFSASLFAFVGVFSSFDAETLRAGLSDSIPRKWPGTFMVASGVITLAIWLIEPVGALISGETPKSLDTHTTLFTNALDIAVIVPTALVAGLMILRRRPFGYVIAFSLLVLEALLMPVIVIATVAQIRMGVSFTPGEIVGPIAGFSTFALVSIWVIAVLLRHIPPSHSTSLDFAAYLDGRTTRTQVPDSGSERNSTSPPSKVARSRK
jgi:hypothetical protein